MEKTGFSEASIPVFKIVQHLENFGVFSAASLKFRILLDTTLRGWVTAHRRFGRKQFPHLEWPIASIILICTVVWSSLTPTHTPSISAWLFILRWKRKMKNRGNVKQICQEKFNYWRHCLFKPFYKHRYKSGGETWSLYAAKAKARHLTQS